MSVFWRIVIELAALFGVLGLGLFFIYKFKDRINSND